MPKPERQFYTVGSVITELQRQVRLCDERMPQQRLLKDQQRLQGRKRGLLSAIGMLRTFQREVDRAVRG